MGGGVGKLALFFNLSIPVREGRAAHNGVKVR